MRAFENRIRAEQAAGAQAEISSQPPAERIRHRGERRGEVISRGKGYQRGGRGRSGRTITGSAGSGGQGVENPADPVGDIATVQSQQIYDFRTLFR